MADAAGSGDLSKPSRVEEAMARVRATLPAKANGSRATAVGSRALPQERNLFPEDVYRSLHQARTIGGGISVNYSLGWRTPIVGQIWMLVRRRIHAEIRIYIDALTQQQSNLNTHVVRVMTHAVDTLDGLGLPSLKRQQAEQAQLIEELRAEVRELRAEVEQLQRAAGLDMTSSAPRPESSN